MNRKPVGKLDLFFSRYKRLYYRRRDMILRADDIPSGVFFLSKGYVRLYTLSESGQELTLIIFKPKDIFPIMWAINNTPNTQYLEAITPVELYRAPKDKFLEFTQTNPEVLYELTSKILIRLGGLLDRMEYLVFGNAYQKIASILVICAERFGEKRKKEIVIKVPLAHRDIATLVGLTRETTSIEIKQLEKKGIIDHRGRLLVVKNMNKLQKESLWGTSI